MRPLVDAETALFDEFAALPARVVAESCSTSWHRPGLLSFWVDDAGRADLEAVLGVPMDGNLLTWAAAPAEGEGGEALSNSLWGTVAQRLLGFSFSYVRFRLAFLFSPDAWFGDPALRAWLAEHVQVVGLPWGAGSAQEVCSLLTPPTPGLFRPSGAVTVAQARETEIREAVKAVRLVRRGEAGRQMRAEVRARREGRAPYG